MKKKMTPSSVGRDVEQLALSLIAGGMQTGNVFWEKDSVC